MDASLVVDWSREAVRMALLLGAPALVAALAVGLVVGAVQTLTQMHDPVVGQVPRLVAVAVVLLLTLSWMFTRWIAYASDLIASIPDRL